MSKYFAIAWVIWMTAKAIHAWQQNPAYSAVMPLFMLLIIGVPALLAYWGGIEDTQRKQTGKRDPLIRALAWLLAWAFFGIGHAISRTLLRIESAGICRACYPAYSALMSWALDVQVWAGVHGPWRAEK